MVLLLHNGQVQHKKRLMVVDDEVSKDEVQKISYENE